MKKYKLENEIVYKNENFYLFMNRLPLSFLRTPPFFHLKLHRIKITNGVKI